VDKTQRTQWLKLHSANIITWFRLILAVGFLTTIFVRRIHDVPLEQYWYIAIWLFIALLDLLDGYCARKFKRQPDGTLLDDGGATLDEQSDKIAINAAFFVFAFFGQISWYFFFIMLARDIFTYFLRKPKKSPVKSARGPGKFKTFCQNTTIIVVFLPEFPNKSFLVLALVSLSTALSIVSGMQYFVLAMDAKSDGNLLKETGGQMGVPNWFTLSRIALAPLIAYAFFKQPFGDFSNIVGTILMTTAVLTDMLDGTIARRSGQTTNAGKMLDMLSDKIIFYFCLAGLIAATRGTFMIPYFEIPFISAIVIFCVSVLIAHDILFIGGYACAKKVGDNPSSNNWDRVRFAFTCIWIIVVGFALTSFGSILNLSPALERTPFNLIFSYGSFFVLFAAMVLSCITAGMSYEYLKSVIKRLVAKQPV